MPRISIVMTSFNQEAFVAAAIESVRNQTFSDWELLAVDDGSADRGHAVALEFAQRDARIRALQKENGGHCTALNFGVLACDAGSDYLFFLDGDDLLKPGYLEATSRYLDGHPEVGLVCCQADQADSAGRIEGKFHRSRWVPGRWGMPRDLGPSEAATPFVTFFCATGIGMTGLYRRSVFARTAGWDPRFTRHEDTDMFCQMALLAEVHYLPDALYIYRVHEKGITRLTDAEAVRDIPAFKAGGYEAFRQKWDHFAPRNDAERRVLTAARRHYYGVHRPLRSAKVSLKALWQSLSTGRPKLLRWSAVCAWESVAGAMGFWLLRRNW